MLISFIFFKSLSNIKIFSNFTLELIKFMAKESPAHPIPAIIKSYETREDIFKNYLLGSFNFFASVKYFGLINSMPKLSPFSFPMCL